MLNALGLFFFLLLIDNSFKGLVALIVVMNGIICHGSKYIQSELAEYCMYYDVICNVLMGLYILFTAEYQLMTFIAIFFACSVFIINKLYYESYYLFHILGVQFPLAFMLSYY